MPRSLSFFHSIRRVTIRPAFGGLVPLFRSQIPLFASVKHNGFNQIYVHFNEFSNKSRTVRCGCRLDCGDKGTDLKTQTKIGVISKKKKKKRSTHARLQNSFTFGLENNTNRGTNSR